jgi:hypothetical protein
MASAVHEHESRLRYSVTMLVTYFTIEQQPNSMRTMDAFIINISIFAYDLIHTWNYTRQWTAVK